MESVKPPSVNNLTSQPSFITPNNIGITESEKQLRAQVDALQKTIDLITQNTNLVDRFANVPLGMPKIQIWFYNDNMIKSCKKIKDSVDYFTPELKKEKREEQLIELYFFNEEVKPVTIDLFTFIKSIEKKIVECEESPVIKKDGKTYYRYKYEGKNYEISSEFIN